MSRIVRSVVPMILAVTLLTSEAACQQSVPAISAEAYILMEADSGRVLCAHNETQEKSIASTTKIMTALVALEHSAPSEIATVKRSELKEGSSMYLKEGERLTVEELLYGLLLPSGNDAAECLAGHCAPSRAQFVAWMNEKAAALGMTHTHFTNPSGLDEAGHYSCALDMARLAAYAMQDPTFLRIASTSTASVGSRTMTNHNKLLARFDGCIGLKTGYTGDAGRTLVTCAERNGMRLIAVTLRDGNDWDDHTALYEYGFSAYRMECLTRCGARCTLVPVSGGSETEVGALAAATFAYPVCAGEKITVEYRLPETIAAPLTEGAHIGEAIAVLDGREIGRVGLLCGKSIETAETKKDGFAEWLVRMLTK